MQLLGPDSVEDKKTEFGRRIDIIGWVIDLDLRSVSIARHHNFLKTFYGFMAVEEEQPVAVKTMEKLASWASRYGMVCTAMKPFAKDLYAEISGKSRRSTIILGEHAKRCVRLWRSCLVALELKREKFSRPLSALREKPVEWLVEYDASLGGVGLVLFRLGSDGEETVEKAVKIVFPEHLGTNSGLQNTVEFTAVVMGLGCLAALGVRDTAVRLRGDNTSSLAWSVHHRFSDGYSRRAAVAYITLSEGTGLRVDDGVHIAGKENVTCDRLSRDVSLSDLGFAGDKVFKWEEDDRLVSLLKACAPFPEVDSDEEVSRLWGENARIVKSFMG